MSTQLAGQGPYQSGNPITLEALFVAGTTPVDPAVVVFSLRKPDDTLQTYTFGVDGNVTNPSVGEYLCLLPTNWLPGQTYYEAVSTNPDSTLPGEFVVIPSSVIVPPEAPGPKMPPCTSWIAGEDLAGTSAAGAASPVTLDAVAVMASMLCFELSGRQWSGLCGPVTLRPCAGSCSGLPWGWGSPQAYTWGYWPSGEWGGYSWGWGYEGGSLRCDCGYDSHIELSGYPVSQVTQVKIDGTVLPATFADSGAAAYRLDEWRYLTRLSDPASPTIPLRWPRCQRLDLADDQLGTWSVTYLYGVAPPPLGIEAAKQLGAQMLLAINGQACQLPTNIRQMIRQGATIDRITPLAAELRTGGTGLFLFDSFIAAYNPRGLRRRPSIFSPDTRFPVRIGNE